MWDLAMEVFKSYVDKAHVADAKPLNLKVK